MAGDLVDYLRDKLDHADDPPCTCVWVDITAVTDADRTCMLNSGDCPAHPERRVGQTWRWTGAHGRERVERRR